MSAPVQPSRILPHASVPILTRNCESKSSAPLPEQPLIQPFLGESQEAATFATISKGGVSSVKRSRPLQGAAIEAGEQLMARKLKFAINGKEIFRTVEQALQCYKRGFEKTGHQLLCAKLVGSSCPAFLGSKGIGECLEESIPASRPLHVEEMTHIETQISDVDFFLDMRKMAQHQKQDQEIAPDLLQSIEEEFWWERASFKVQFNNMQIGQLHGFKALVDLFSSPPNHADPASWCCVNNIRIVKGPYLDERVFLPTHLQVLIELTAAFRDNPYFDRRCFFPHAAQIFEQLYQEPLRVFIKRTAFDEWHYFQQHQRHRMSCRDVEGRAYDFTVQISGEDLPPRMVYQEFAVNFATFLNGSRELQLEGSDLALAHKLCRLKLWTSHEKLPRDFFYSQWMNALGYRDADLKSEEQLVQLLTVFCSKTPNKALALAEMVDQELLARKCVEQAKERKPRPDTFKQLQKLVEQAPRTAEALVQVIDEELEETSLQLVASLVNADMLLRKIQALGAKSRWFDGVVHNLIEYHLHAEPVEGKRSKTCDPARTMAFLLNASAYLPKCTENELFRFWYYLAPLIPTQFKTDSLFSLCHEAILARSLNPRQIFAALTVLSFETLMAPLQVRQGAYLQPTIEMHEGKPVIHLLVERQTLQMPLDLAEPLETLCTVKGKPSSEVLQSLFAFGKSLDSVDPASPLLKWKKELNLDFKALCKCVLIASQNADPAIRALSHRLLMTLLFDEVRDEVIAAIPELMYHESDNKERMHLCDCFIKRLNDRFGAHAVAELTVQMKWMAGKVHSFNEWRLGIMLSMARLRVQPFPELAVDMWKSMDSQEKNRQAQMLYEALKGSLPAKAIEVARWKVEENGLKGDEAGRMLQDLGRCVFQDLHQDRKNLQLLFDFADLLVVYSSHHQEPPVATLVLVLQAQAGACWMDFASVCERKGLLAKGPLSEAAQLLRHPQEKQNAEKLGAVARGLRVLYIETRDPVLATAILQFHAAVMHLWSAQRHAEKRSGYEEWVRLAVAQRSDLVMELLRRFSETELFKQDRQGARLLLDVCNYAGTVNLALFRYAIDRGYWKHDDYQADFEAYLKLYMIIRAQHKESGIELREYLLKARPDHPQLNEEMRRKKFRELEKNLKPAVPLPQQVESLREILLIAESENERQTVLRHANRILPQLNPLEEHIEWIETFQRQYPQCNLEPVLAMFQVARSSPAQLVTFARLLPASLETVAKTCIQRLIELNEHLAALDLLEKTQVADDLIWMQCLQAVAKNSPANHTRAWELSLTRKKWSRFALHPKGRFQICENWYAFDLIQMQLLLDLLISGNRSQDWKGLIAKRVEAARSPEDPHNVAYASDHFMRTRLLGYLQLLLPVDLPHRYSRLFEEIGLLREAVTPSLMEGVASSPLPELDLSRLQCALRSGNQRYLTEGLQLLSKLLEEDRDVHETVFSAVKQTSSFIPRHANLMFVLGQLLERYAGRSTPAHVARIVDLFLASKKPQLLDFAVEMACGSPAQKGSEETHLKLARRLTEIADPRIQKLLSHCVTLLSEEQLCRCICDYLDAVMRARKDISDPIDPSGVALCNALLPHLSSQFKLRCVDKALDHLCLIFDHPEAFRPSFIEMRSFLEEMEARHFCKAPEGSFVMNTVLAEWLKRSEKIDVVSVLSPRWLAQACVQFWMGSLVNTSLLVPAQDGKTFWKMLEDQMKQKFQAIEEKFVSLQLDLSTEQNIGFVYEVSVRFVSKCLKRTATPEWSGEFLSASIWHRLEFFAQFHFVRHQDWMPHLMEWVFYPPAYTRAEFAKRHFSYAKNLFELLRSSKPGVLHHYPKESFALDCYLNYRATHGEVTMREIINKSEQQSREIKFLLERIWKSEQLRGNLHALYFTHFACVTFLLSEPSQFKKWYGKLIEEMLNHKDRSRDASWDAFNLTCHLRTDLKGREHTPGVQEMHARHGLQIVQHFCDFVNQMAILPKEDHEDKLLVVAQAAWEYFTLINQKFADRIGQKELVLAQIRLVTCLEEGLNTRFQDPKWRAEESTRKLMDFLYTLPYTSSSNHLQGRYRLIFDDVNTRPSWQILALLFAVAKDLERPVWGHLITGELVVSIHRELWQEMAAAMAAGFEKGPIPENREQFSLSGKYFAAAMAYLKRAESLFSVDVKNAEERISAAYQQQYARAFETISSGREINVKAFQHLHDLAADLENRDDKAVKETHRLHWKRIVDAYASIITVPKSYGDGQKIDIFYTAMMYLVLARRRFMNESNRSDFVQQQQRLMASMSIFHQHFLESTKELRRSSETLNQVEIVHLIQLCRIGDTLLDEIRDQSYPALCHFWKETVNYLCDRLNAMPIQPAAATNASVSLVRLPSPHQIHQAAYDPWLSAMSFLNEGRNYFAESNRLEEYFEAIHKISTIYRQRGNHSPDHYLYYFKLLTDEFPKAGHQEASRLHRCTQISHIFRILAESGNVSGQTAAIIYLKWRHQLETLFGNLPLMKASQEILAKFEQNTTVELLASMEKIDLSSYKPDTKCMMIFKS
ncbi:MAG: hypothetical protein LLG04_00215 [Parachlamydia sp.]|nr:hypothetical protein [Parachlamydia sp.]